MTRPEDLPDGAELAEDLDTFFKSGNFGDFLNSASAESTKPPVDEVLREKLNGHIERFITVISLGVVKTSDRRYVANTIRNGFAIWKTGMTQELTAKAVDESEIEAVDSLALKDIANYAGEQFDRFRKEAATLPVGTPEQQEARNKSDYWSFMEEIITPAADPD